jgi:hypothetical protein
MEFKIMNEFFDGLQIPKPRLGRRKGRGLNQAVAAQRCFVGHWLTTLAAGLSIPGQRVQAG